MSQNEEVMEEEILEVYYEDGTRFLTKEEYDKLYTFHDLQKHYLFDRIFSF
jgi:hypothetical protein